MFSRIFHNFRDGNVHVMDSCVHRGVASHFASWTIRSAFDPSLSEVWVFDDSEYISKRILHGCDLDSTTDVLDIIFGNCTQLYQTLELTVAIFNSPIRYLAFAFDLPFIRV